MESPAQQRPGVKWRLVAEAAEEEQLRGCSAVRTRDRDRDRERDRERQNTDTDTDRDLKQKSERQCGAKQLAPSDSQVIGEEGKRWALT